MNTCTGRFVANKLFAEECLIRDLDLILSIFVLSISIPLIILISFLIKVFPPGSILYTQDRVGKDGKIFTLYKFRTMINDAEKHAGPIWASLGDKRVTPLGRLLRQVRLDELPQLYNVIRGDMSLVGPRPERPHFTKLHEVLRGSRLAVKPGLTGLAQIRGSYDLNPQHKVKYDLLYVQKRSLLLNLYILVKTIFVIISRRGR